MSQHPKPSIGAVPEWATIDHSDQLGRGHIVSARGQPEFLTVAEAASLLRVSEKTIRRQIDRGELPVCRVGRSVRISAKDLEALIYSGRIEV